MRISYIQTRLHWEQPDRNRAMLAAKIAPLAGHTDLIVLPEMFTTGFSMQPQQHAETTYPPDATTLIWMQQWAATTHAAIMGSIMCQEGDKFYNRLYFVQPDGRSHYYDKKHLFSLAGEHHAYTAGEDILLVQWCGWNIRPYICYDLRFPVWSRQYKPSKTSAHSDARYDLLVYVANWPQARSHHWRSLLMARAIENQAYVVGVNIVGTDGNGLEYIGDSMVIDYSGQTLAHSAASEQVLTVQLDKDALQAYRAKLPFLEDADAYLIY
jgi:omega-amidase